MYGSTRGFIIFAEALLMVALICNWLCFIYNEMHDEGQYDTQYETLSMGIVSSFACILIIFPLFMADNVNHLYKVFALCVGYAGIVLLIAGCFIIHKLKLEMVDMTKGEKFAYSCGLIGIIFGSILLIGSGVIIGTLEDEKNVKYIERPVRSPVIKEPPKVVKKEMYKPIEEEIFSKDQDSPVIELTLLERPKEQVVKLEPESIEQSIEVVRVAPCSTPITMDDVMRKKSSIRKLSSFEPKLTKKFVLE